jgi:hypothetical protein
MSDYDEQPGPAPEHQGSGFAAADESGPADDDGVAVRHVAGDGWEAPATGVPAVDDVLASIRAIDDGPVDEHVAVFEQAHERLRRALDPGHG